MDRELITSTEFAPFVRHVRSTRRVGKWSYIKACTLRFDCLADGNNAFAR